MLTNAVIACVAIAAAAATNSPPAAVATNEAVVVCADEQKHVPPAVPSTNILQTVENRSDLNSTVWNAVCVKVVHPDDASDDFSVDDWAEELADKGEQGVHVKNDHALVVVRLDPVEGEHQSLTKLRAKFRAIEFLRYHYQDMPKEFSAPCRILFCDLDDERCVVIVAFRLKDIK